MQLTIFLIIATIVDDSNSINKNNNSYYRNSGILNKKLFDSSTKIPSKSE